VVQRGAHLPGRDRPREPALGGTPVSALHDLDGGQSRPHRAALFHGTISDLFIAAAVLMVSLVILGDKMWPTQRFWRVGLFAMLLGVGYTLYSE
jgi:hypothetical protein